MEVPDFVLDTYKRYKLETEKVVTWLAETARDFTQYDLLPPASSKRAQKKKKATTTKIPLMEFSALATAIVEADLPVEIPTHILHNLNNVIIKRIQCNEWFSLQEGDKNHVQSNYSHLHFINVFQEVRGILLSGGTTAAFQKGEQRQGGQEEDEEDLRFTNAFDRLEVEEASSGDDFPPALPAETPKKSISNSRFVIERSEDDVWFDIFCFYDELGRIREYLRKLWQQYAEGKVELMNVSLVTDTAFDLMERAETEFRESLSMASSGNVGTNDTIKYDPRIVLNKTLERVKIEDLNTKLNGGHMFE